MAEIFNCEKNLGKEREGGTAELVKDVYLPLTEKKLGVALVGLGKYSTEQLAPALQETRHCSLAGIVTGTESKIQEWKVKYSIADSNIYNYENFDDICSNKEINILYIVLPNALHA